MGEIALTGALVLSPNLKDGTFPAAETTVALAATADEYLVSHVGLSKVDSASAFATLSLGPVTKGTLVYARCDSPVLYRVTTADDAALVPSNGLTILEFPKDHELTLLEVQGTATIEYLVAGQS